MPKNTKVQQFRDNATEEKWKELVKNATSTVPVGKNIQKEYKFSWSAIMNDAAERGYYEKRVRSIPPSSDDSKPEDAKSEDAKSEDARTFMVNDLPEEKENVISRSVQLDKSIYNRLQTLEKVKRQYTHKAILNQLLSDALKLYGY
jgi:hypothetical protein